MTEKDVPGPTPSELKAHELETLWRKLADQITAEAKGQIGKLYIAYGLGLGEETAELFADPAQHHRASHRVGLAQAGIRTEPEDLPLFWQEVKKLAPEIVPTEEDLTFLVEKGGNIAPFFLIMGLHDGTDGAGWRHNPSLVLSTILVNAHVYK